MTQQQAQKSPLVSIRQRMTALASMYFHLVNDGEHPDTITVVLRASDGRTHSFRHAGGLAFSTDELKMATEESSIPTRPTNIRLPRNALWLSPIAERVLAAMERVEENAWLSSEKIASRVSQPLNDSFKAILGELVDRNMMESSPGRGYRLLRDRTEGEVEQVRYPRRMTKKATGAVSNGAAATEACCRAVLDLLDGEGAMAADDLTFGLGRTDRAEPFVQAEVLAACALLLDRGEITLEAGEYALVEQ